MRKLIVAVLVLALPACGGSSSGPTSIPTPPPTTLPAIFTISGSGDNVFDLPARITRIKITGAYTDFASNFIVKIAGSLVVNELMGTGFNQTKFEGTYLITAGGTVQITNSTGVVWTFTEVR